MSSPQNGFFLPLAPATSSSYPRAPASRANSTASSSNGVVTTAALPQQEQQQQPSSRRSSSSSSTGYRVLKLGPVHWGEHLDDHKLDYHETVVLP
ncbi:actin [Purpureocillium lavendulum]|uniref:Actin n=1 Tax=Purpureocillium lavendulum TaxID=1247861 RepID=A0AB34FXB6_9HYPO|nr:actin [Purpureocillium lavendulum]